MVSYILIRVFGWYLGRSAKHEIAARTDIGDYGTEKAFVAEVYWQSQISTVQNSHFQNDTDCLTLKIGKSAP